MKAAPFRYLAPDSLEEAVSLLAEHGDEAKALAGGQSLVPLMAFRFATPSVLVDLNRIDGLDRIRIDADMLAMGALARHRDVELTAGLEERCPMIHEAVGLIGHVAIRNRGTVGGSIAHADPAAEWPGLLTALDGEVDAVGPSGRRTILADALFDSYFTTTLRQDELITDVRVRLPEGRSGSAFGELARRHGDFAIAGAGVVLGFDDEGSIERARVALIGVGERPILSQAAEQVLLGADATDGVFELAATAAASQLEPMSDVHGTADYRRHLALTLTRRALATARDRAFPERN